MKRSKTKQNMAAKTGELKRKENETDKDDNGFP